MHWKLPIVLGLTLLGGAAAPPTDCPDTSQTTPTYPTRTDLTGQGAAPAGLASVTFAARPEAEGGMPCHTAAPSSPLLGESSDAIHGLPAPDILRPIADPLHQ